MSLAKVDAVERGLNLFPSNDSVNVDRNVAMSPSTDGFVLDFLDLDKFDLANFRLVLDLPHYVNHR